MAESHAAGWYDGQASGLAESAHLPNKMKITRITVWQVALPLKHPYQLSGGRLRDLPAHGPGVRAGIGMPAPAVLGCDACAVDEVNRVMDRALPGHLYAKSALDIACWDILGQAVAPSPDALGAPAAVYGDAA